MLCTTLLTGCGARGTAVGVPSRKGPPPGPSHRATPDVRDRLVAGVRAYRSRRFVLAREMFDRALVVDPRNVEARYDRARTYEKLAKWTVVASDLRVVTIARPDWNNARLQLAVARYHIRQFERAAEDFDRVLRREPRQRDLWLDAGRSYYRARDYRRATERFRHAVAIAPRSGRARLWLGLAYSHDGRRLQARRELLLAARSHDDSVRRAARLALASAAVRPARAGRKSAR